MVEDGEQTLKLGFLEDLQLPLLSLRDLEQLVRTFEGSCA